MHQSKLFGSFHDTGVTRSLCTNNSKDYLAFQLKQSVCARVVKQSISPTTSGSRAYFCSEAAIVHLS